MTYTPTPTLQLIGGPTALITYGGLRLLTDPTFDPPGEHPSPPVVLHKLAGPAVPREKLPPIDAVLLSHDHHADNLDDEGRALLGEAGRVLTTVDGAGRLGMGATGLRPGDALELDRADGGKVTVTAVPAQHGPPEVAEQIGPVIGFVLRSDGLPATYVSGDNASVDLVQEIVAEHGPIDVAVLFVGGAQVSDQVPDAHLTLTAEMAVGAAQAIDGAAIVPVHQDGWAHFTSNAEDVRRAFSAAGIAGRLRPVAPGEWTALGKRGEQ